MNITLPTLADQLGIQVDSLRRQTKRLDIDIQGGQLNEEQYKLVVREYSRPSGRRPAETVERAQALAGQLGIASPAAISAKVDKPVTRRRTSTRRSRPAEVQMQRPWIDRFLMSRSFLLVVLLSCLAWQVQHTAGLIGRMDAGEPLWSNYCYALGIQFTALLLTLHQGGRGYLLGYALFEFLINLLYYEPWMAGSTDWQVVWSRALLISGGIAFAIYSYSAILTTRTK